VSGERKTLLVEPYLRLMAQKHASDLFFYTGAPVSIKIQGVVRPVNDKKMTPGQVQKLAYDLLTPRQIEEFETTKEMDLGLSLSGIGRYRINVFYQRSEASMVIRYIKADIPTIEELQLPMVVKELVMHNTGLVLIVGSTGSGKSTSMAAMIDYRNESRPGHILTIEDPVEFVFRHKKSLVGQREVGLDTLSYDNALREAMREAPDMIMIGEIRDVQTMKAAIAYADTGHLVLSTLHAVNANQALDRIINFFPPDAKNQILMDLSLNLRGIVSQRLVIGIDGKRVPAVEVLINSPYIQELIKKGSIKEIKEVMEKDTVLGMQTFDQALYDLYKAGKITLEDALSKADSRANLEWRINFGGGMKSLKTEEEEFVRPTDTPPPGDIDVRPGWEQPKEPESEGESAPEPFDEPDGENEDDPLADLKPLSDTITLEGDSYRTGGG
jgi:twitching motility protein PilU